MISQNGVSKRKMLDSEQVFVNRANNVFIQFAMEVEHPKYLPIVLEKVKNSLSGLYTKTDGFNFLSNFKDPSTVTIHKIPKEIKTLTDCCDWIYKAYTPNVDYSLASIAADDTRIVINSNHSISDGGFFNCLLENIQDPTSNWPFEQQASIPKDVRNDLFKEEFDKIQKKFEGKNGYDSILKNKLTHFDLQEVVDLPDAYNVIPTPFRAILKAKELSPFIYDKSSQKVKHLTEFLWTGLCLSICAKNGRFGPIGVGTCMDFRRLLPKEKIDRSFGNCFTNFFVTVKDASPKMTINEICSSFRDSFNIVKQNNSFFKDFLFPPDFAFPKCPISYVSNVGPNRIKTPIKDFYAQCTSTEIGIRPAFLVTSYSKLKKENDMNDVVICMRTSPRVVGRKVSSDVFETYLHFLKNVDPRMKSGDVLDELIHFQKSLE
ncbi:hypothetical protein M9Y10_040604 [Tritrichomonas musculus]|uniref:Condensation domain-containing protein n=1 Tax=Tritrichomonas musculus TaxID=1915356 RepID=A0ABR2GQD0_9EUKA